MSRAGPRELAGMRRAAARAASEIEGTFEEVPRLLFELLDRSDAAATALATLSDACGPEGRRTLGRLSETAAETLATVVERLRALSSLAGDMRNRSHSIGGLLHEIRRDLRATRMVAVNAQVVSRSIPSSDGLLEHFANGTRGLLDEVEQSLCELDQHLDSADSRMSAAQPELDACAAEIGALGELHRGLPAMSEAAFAADDLAGSARSAAERVATLQDELRDVIVRLQSGDSVRQRFEHVATMAELARNAGQSDAATIEALCRAQASAAAEALEEAVTQTLARLRGMTSISEACSADIRRILDSDATARLVGLVGKLAEGDDLAGLLERSEALRQDLGDAAAAYGAVAKSAATIANADGAIHLLGLNATLVSARLGPEGRAMTEVSRQLRECTSKISEDTGRLVALTRAQETAVAEMTWVERDPAPAGGVADLDGLETRTGALTEAVAALGRAEVADLGTAGRDARAALNAFLARFRAHSASAQASARGAAHAPLPLSRPLAQRIRELYSMEEERAIHDRLLGTGPGPGDTLEQPPDSDDVFFG